MTDHDIIPPGTDDEIRARLRAFAEEVKERTDTEAALRRVPRHSRPPIVGLLEMAACLLAVVALVAAVTADRQGVHTSDPSNSPPQSTDCPSTTQPRATTQGAQMKNRFAVPVASAATAILLLGACSDDDSSTTTTEPSTTEAAGPTSLAKGEDVEFVGEEGLAGQTLNVTAEEENGEVTGEFRITNVVVPIQCADTETDGVIILGGEVTDDPDNNGVLGDLLALIIREGDPDSVALLANETNAGSCTELLDSVSQDQLNNESTFVDVEDSYNIETG